MNYSDNEYSYMGINEVFTKTINIPQNISYTFRLHLNYNWLIYIALFIMIICICYINHLKKKLFNLLNKIIENNFEIKKELEIKQTEIKDIKKELEIKQIEIDDIRKKMNKLRHYRNI